MTHVDYLIKNALVIDGTGRPGQRLDVSICNDKIFDIGKDSPNAKSIIDGENFILSPGFIDIHGHTDHYLCIDPECSSKVLQGVTTEVFGNCGYSPVIHKKFFRSHFSRECRMYPLNARWNDLDTFSAETQNHRPAMNWMSLVGHGSLRIAAMGHNQRPPSSHELEWMKHELEKAMDQGACGLSTGLIYTPGCFASQKEIISLCKVVSKKRGFYATHMKSEGDHLIESIEESIQTAQESQVPLQISHLKTAGEKNWQKLDEALATLETGIMDGVDISWDRYPYSASYTSLDTSLPRSLFDGGDSKAVERLKSPKVRKKMSEIILSKGPHFNQTLIASVRHPSDIERLGQSLETCALNAGRSIPDFVIDLLIRNKMQVYAIFFSMSDENLKIILRHPKTMIGSDAAARTAGGKTFEKVVHPRTYGTFPRVISEYVLKNQLLSLEDAIRKMTGLTADRLKLKKRGYIKKGNFADLVLIHQKNIRDRATFANPTLNSSGIEWVFVNGKPVVRRGLQTKFRTGRFIPYEP